MKRLISLFLILLLTFSVSSPAYASENEERYGFISVEYSDSYGQTEDLEVMVKDDHVYADIYNLSSRLGFDCEQNGELISVVGDTGLFIEGSPSLAIHFKIGENTVSYNPLCGIEQKYTTPVPCTQNARGTWVSLTHTLLLLGASSNVFDDTSFNISKDILVIQMPRDNVLSIAASIVNNSSLLSFNWVDDLGYSETTTSETDGAARIVTLLNGLLTLDPSAWLHLVTWDAFDAKFGKTMTQMLCTYSSDEIQENIESSELLLNVFDSDGTLGQILQGEQIRLEDDWEAWKYLSENYLAKLEAGCGSTAECNLLYQQYERAMDEMLIFSSFGDHVNYIQGELSQATNALDVASTTGSLVTYAAEFQNRDKFLSASMKAYLDSRYNTQELSQSMVNSMKIYLKSTDWGGVGYTASWFIIDQLPEFLVDTSNIKQVLGAPANVALFAWDIMSETIPFYKEGLDAVEKREISNYTQMLQNDALLNINSLLGDMKASTSPLDKEQCMQLSQYCYVYLKACYLSRETAIESLNGISEEAHEKIEGELQVEADINQKIAKYLAFLSGVTDDNKLYSLGFLDGDNTAFLNKCSDDSLIAIVKENSTDLVTDAYANDCTYTDTVYNTETEKLEETEVTSIFRIPQINLPGNTVKRINAEIYDALHPTIESSVEGIAEYGYPLTSLEVSYRWAVNDNILSLVILEVSAQVVWDIYMVYNIDISSGEEVSTAALIQAAGFSEAEYYERAKQVLGSCYWSGWVPSSERFEDQSFVDFFNEQLNRTISDDNIAQSYPYINEEGQLSIIASIYSFALANYHWHDLNMIDFKLSPYYASEAGKITHAINISEDEAYQMACEYWDYSDSEETYLEGYKLGILYDGLHEEPDGNHYYAFRLRWWVPENNASSTVDMLYINAETGECSYSI